MDKIRFRRPRLVLNQYLSYILKQLSLSLDDDVRFVQVGGNDGKLDDPISPLVKAKSWKGLIFEPVPSYFARLQKHYESQPDVMCINEACSNAPGEFEMFYIKPQTDYKLPHYLQGCASTSKERLTAHLVRLLPKVKSSVRDELICAATVPVTTLNQALKAHKMDKVDLLVVDVEGHEIPVVEGFDIERYRPKLALIENNGSDTKFEKDVIAPWKALGYQIVRFGDDIVAMEGDSRWISAFDLARILHNSIPNLKMRLM